jgi:hypothetical protein
MKKTIYSSLLILLPLSFINAANWLPVSPITNGKVINGVARNDSFLFVSNLKTDSSFLRFNLYNNQIRILRKNNGGLFSTNGSIGLVNSGQHLMYSANDSLFISHDNGNSWTKINQITGTSDYLLAYENYFFVGVSNGVFYSKDFGYTFSFMYGEASSSNTPAKPLAVQNNRLFLAHKNGLRSIHLDSLTAILYPTTLNFYNLLSIEGNLIGSVVGKIYQSTDNGITWRQKFDMLNNNNINFLFYDEGLVYATVANREPQVSTNKGINYNLLANGLPTNTSAWQLTADSAHVYVTTDKGLYRVNKSQYVKRIIEANVFFDANKNGIWDTNEKPVQGQRINSKKSLTFYSNNFGKYQYIYNWLMDTMSVESSFSYLKSAKGRQPANFTYSKVWFPMVADSLIGNCGISLVPLNEPAPGKQTLYSVEIFNEGTITTNSTVNIALDSKQKIDSTSISNATINGNNLTLQRSLEPFERQKCIIYASLRPGSNIGDTLNISAEITPKANDADTFNNNIAFYQVTDSTFKEAGKWVIPQESITPDFIKQKRRLNYFVRYSHRQTSPISYFSIGDTLKPTLQHPTFNLVSCSHNFASFSLGSFYYIGSADTLRPVDSNAVAGTFFIHFSILPDSTLKVNDIITNNAEIECFPYSNIITNTAVTVVVSKTLPIGMNDLQTRKALVVYPNPATDMITVKKPFEPVAMFNLLGEEIPLRTLKEEADETSYDISILKPGMYFINSKQKQVLKLIKQP